MKTKTIACLPDLHAPFHDARSLALFIAVIKDIKPDVLVCLGDIADFYALSKYDKDPHKTRTFAQELVTVKKILDRLDGLAPRKIFTAGNHENRLNKYLLRNAPALSDYLTIESALGLKERGWEFYPYQEPVKVGKVGFVHDLGGAGVNATREMTAKYPRDVVFGHTHRLNCFTRGNLERHTYTAWNAGWLGDARAIDYRSSVAVKQDWAKGFVIVHLEANGTPHFEGVKINSGKCLVGGKFYASR